MTAQTVQSKHSASAEAQRRTDLTGYLFVAPFALAFLIFFIAPVGLGLYMSFTDWSLVGAGTSQFLGLQNYAELLGDPTFWSSLWHTVVFTLLSTPPLVILALVFAMLANRAVPARWFFRLAFFAPYVLPVSVVCLIWIWLYQPGFGLINGFLTLIGLPEIAWLADPSVTMISVVLMTVWWTIGLNFILYLAGLQEIPPELYDASATDGANSWAQTRYITLPLLARTTTLVLALQILASLNLFDQVYIMSTAGDMNVDNTRPSIMYIYEQGFTSYRVGFASAMSYAFFLIVVSISMLQFVVVNRRRRDA